MSQKGKKGDQKKIDLLEDNKRLESEIVKRGGIIGMADNIEPEIQNDFMKNIIAFEEAEEDPQIPMRTLFPVDYAFPAAESMSPEELTDKLNDIITILSDHHIELGFCERLPDNLLYKHMVEKRIPTEKVSAFSAPGFSVVLDGCTGLCEECFQSEYCDTKEEI